MIDHHTLHVARLHQGLTAQELADRVGYARSTVTMIETGRRTPTDEYLHRVLAVLDFEIEELK